MSRTGPYAVLLAAAIALLAAAQPEFTSGLLLHLSGVSLRPDGVARGFLLLGSIGLLLGLLWLVRQERVAARHAAFRQAMAAVANRIGARLAEDRALLRIWSDAPGAGALSVELRTWPSSALLLRLDAPARTTVWVRQREDDAAALPFRAVAVGMDWELRVAGQDAGRGLGRDAELLNILDKMFAQPLHRPEIRHDQLGVAVAARRFAAEDVEVVVENSYAAAARLAQLNG